MDIKTVKINLKTQRKPIEIEMTKTQLQAFKTSLESVSKFVDIAGELYINKNEIVLIEIEGD